MTVKIIVVGATCSSVVGAAAPYAKARSLLQKPRVLSLFSSLYQIKLETAKKKIIFRVSSAVLLKLD